jgi:hypothetical protein
MRWPRSNVASRPRGPAASSSMARPRRGCGHSHLVTVALFPLIWS